MELQRNTHHVYRLMYHFVWIPKYRHKVFSEPYRSVLKGIIEKSGYGYDIEIVELAIPEDYLHKVVRGVPKMSPSQVMPFPLVSSFGIPRDKEALFLGQ